MFFTMFLCLFAFSLSADAVDLYQEDHGTWNTKVVEIIEQGERDIPGFDIDTFYQIIDAEILEGTRKGEIITINNDFVRLEKGDKFFVNYLLNPDGSEVYSMSEPDRRIPLYFFIGLFVLVILFFGKFQGLRSLLSLAGSFFVIIFFLLPNILNGANPVVISVIASTVILVLAIYLTHGVNKKSTSALLGTIITIFFTGILASVAVNVCKFSGFASDESVYLNIVTGGQINFNGLLLGAIIIGVLGILDDIAITQASAVKELHGAAPHLSRKDIYRKSLRIGREHVGALVNTLALAYAGAAMPLLLLVYSSGFTSMILNKEIFATEVIRTIVGSIGLILAVPITTLIAVLMLVKNKAVEKEGVKNSS